MGTQDPLNSFRTIQDQARQLDSGVVEGSSTEPEGELRTEAPDTADEMLEQYKNQQKPETMTTKRKKLKSPRYSDVPAYSLEAVDTELLKEDLNDALDLSEAEKQVAGYIAKNDVSGLSHEEIGRRAGTSKASATKTIHKLETRQNPSSSQREMLQFARENPDMSVDELSDELEEVPSSLLRTLVPYRHERIVCEVEVPEKQDSNKETQGETTVGGEQDTFVTDEEDAESVERDPVERDLNGDDSVTYKYSTGDETDEDVTISAEPDYEDDPSPQTVKSRQDLISILSDLDERLSEVEDSQEDTPAEVKGRLVSLENRLEGLQSVVDRIENQQTNVERYVEKELEGADVPGTIEDRLDRIEDTLASHKEAIQELREQDTPASTEFSTEEKRKIIVALAENDQDDLIDRVLDEF